MEGAEIFTLTFDVYQTLGIAIFALVFGGFLKQRIPVLDRLCIPSPVIGGLIFAIIATILYFCGLVNFKFDSNLKEFAMVMFFTSIGFQADFKALKRGGKSFIILLLLVVVLILAENFTAVGVSKLVGIDPLLGLGTGSISMVGCPGTAAAFGPLIEAKGIEGAATVSIAAAAFGLAISSIIGGPIGKFLINRKKLAKPRQGNKKTGGETKDKFSMAINEEMQNRRNVKYYVMAFFELGIAMAIGTLVSMLLNLTGLTFPIYIGSLIAAVIFRNLGDISGLFRTSNQEIEDIGDLMLSVFLSITMISLNLTVLANLALPIIILLLAQTVLIVAFCMFVVFPAMGKDYDSAVIMSGTIGFGMGSTPNAMANMNVLVEAFKPSKKAFLVVPIIGCMFSDFINSVVITLFINFL